jgi:hypothetical protein
MQSPRTSLYEPISLLTGKRTGNFIKIASVERFAAATPPAFQRLALKFPTQRNREFSFSEQGNQILKQGNNDIRSRS